MKTHYLISVALSSVLLAAHAQAHDTDGLPHQMPKKDVKSEAQTCDQLADYVNYSADYSKQATRDLKARCDREQKAAKTNAQAEVASASDKADQAKATTTSAEKDD